MPATTKKTNPNAKPLNGHERSYESPYDVLNVARCAANDDTIRVAFRLLAARTHPDRPGGSHGAFQRVSVAYAALRSAEARARYDAWERAQLWYKQCDACSGAGGRTRGLGTKGALQRCSACNGTGLYRYGAMD